ncbi:MAG: M48 family metalloprotease [candidate division Zixibacteria bacterium]|nr:M48 family metalloprotease [candidate division Zixibacteria bacterium]
MVTLHPIEVLRRLGVNELLFGTVLANFFLVALSFLIVRSLLYIESSKQYEAIPVTFWFRFPGTVLILTMLLLIVSFWRDRRRKQTYERFLINDSTPVLKPILKDIELYLKMMSLGEKVRFLYDITSNTPNARLRYIRGFAQIIVTRGLVILHEKNADEALPIVLHELSHVEAHDFSADLRIKWFLRAIHIAFAVAIALCFSIYIIRRFQFYWYDELFTIVPPVLFALLSWFVWILFSRAFFIERELLHDLRAGQLMGDVKGLRSIFMKKLTEKRNHIWRRLKDAFIYFISVHPTNRKRLINLQRLSPFQNVNYLYAYISGALMSMLPVAVYLAAGDVKELVWSDLSEVHIKYLNVPLGVITLYLLLRADFTRFACLYHEGKHSIFKIIPYVAALLFGSLLPAIILIIFWNITSDKSHYDAILRALEGIGYSTVTYMGALLFCSYPLSVRVAVSLKGIIGKSLMVILEFAIIIVCFCFYAVSAGRDSPVALQFAFSSAGILVSILLALTIALVGKCPTCEHRSFTSAFLKQRCYKCGNKKYTMWNYRQ